MIWIAIQSNFIRLWLVQMQSKFFLGFLQSFSRFAESLQIKLGFIGKINNFKKIIHHPFNRHDVSASEDYFYVVFEYNLEKKSYKVKIE